MNHDPETYRVPGLLVVYPLLMVIAFGWTVLASLVMPVVIGFDVMQSDARFYWDWQLSIIAVVFVANFLYSLIFLISSVGVLRKKRKWLSAFRKCAIVLNTYIALSAIVTMVVFPFMAKESKELGLAVAIVMVSMAAAITIVTRRMLKHLSNQDVVGLFY